MKVSELILTHRYWGAAGVIVSVVALLLTVSPVCLTCGPDKQVQLIPEVKVAQMKAYRQNAMIFRIKGTKYCDGVDELPDELGDMTLFGAELKKWSVTYKREDVMRLATEEQKACLRSSIAGWSSWCDEDSGTCKFRGRGKGCYVSKQWLEWARKKYDTLTYDYACRL